MHDHGPAAFVTGLVPCPLTTYALANSLLAMIPLGIWPPIDK